MKRGSLDGGKSASVNHENREDAKNKSPRRDSGSLNEKIHINRQDARHIQIISTSFGDSEDNTIGHAIIYVYNDDCHYEDYKGPQHFAKRIFEVTAIGKSFMIAGNVISKRRVSDSYMTEWNEEYLLGVYNTNHYIGTFKIKIQFCYDK